ncbi:MAG TPA: PAS domain S-box protein [Blastocatellia bacterium]|nr:PAS domain S-box protein [Blastocatellia bacterium]
MSEAESRSVSPSVRATVRKFYRQHRFSLGCLIIGLLVITAMLLVMAQYRRDTLAAKRNCLLAAERMNIFARIQVHFNQASRSRALALIASNPEQIRRYDEQSHQSEAQALQMITEFTLRSTDAGEKRLFEQLRHDLLEVRAFTDRMLAEKTHTDIQALADRYVTEGGAVSERIRDDLRQITGYYQQGFQQQLRDWHEQSNRSFWRMCAIPGTVLLLAGVAIGSLHQRRLREAEQSEQLLRDVFESFNEPIFVVGDGGCVHIWNTASRVRMGRQEAEVIGRPLAEAFPSLRDTELARLVAQVSQATGPRIIPQLALDQAESETLYEVRIFPFRRGATVYARDITRQKKAELAIRRSEELFRAMFAGSPLPMFVCDLKTLEILEVNDQFIESYGWTREEIQHMRLTDIHPPEDLPAFRERLNRRQPGVQVTSESRHQRQNGEIIDVMVYASPLEYQGREAAVIVAQDITARKRTESILRLREAQLREARQFTELVISNAGDGVVVLDCWMRHLLWNQTMERLTGIPAAQALGRHARENFPGLVLAELERCHRQALRGQLVTSPDFQLLSGEGEQLWLSATFAPNRSSAGEILGTIAMFHDVTSRRHAEEALRASEERLREARQLAEQIVSNAGEAVTLYDREMRYRMVNHKVEELTGLKADELLGRCVYDLFPQLKEQGMDRYHQRAMEGETVTTPDFLVTAPNGRTFWAFSACAPCRNARDEIAGIIVITRDVTERRRAEEELKEIAARLTRSNRELQDFAYIASHDLQEPLRKIQTFGDRLKVKCAEALSADGRDYLERMQSAAARMQTLITDLLAFSRVMSREQPFEQVSLDKLAREVISDLEVLIEKTGGRVETNPLPVVEADPTQMRQLLQNLIGNALKFHRPDQPPVVTLSSEIISSANGAPALCQISVADNGIGFDEKYLDRIFAVFQRLHGRSEYEGTGVGLAICRKIVERHGWTITARSEPGAGATFIITLPAQAASVAESAAQAVI